MLSSVSVGAWPGWFGPLPLLATDSNFPETWFPYPTQSEARRETKGPQAKAWLKQLQLGTSYLFFFLHGIERVLCGATPGPTQLAHGQLGVTLHPDNHYSEGETAEKVRVQIPCVTYIFPTLQITLT